MTTNLACAAILFGAFFAADAGAQNSQSEAQRSEHEQAGQEYERPVSWKNIVPNMVSDQRSIWTFPTKVMKNRNWVPTLAVGSVTAALMAADPYEGRYFHTSSTFQGFNSIFTGNATGIGVTIAPVSLYAAGLLRRDPKMQKTALLAGEAIVDSEIVVTVLKDIDKRLRPVAFGSGSNYWDSWFESKGSLLRGAGSFPSGHAIAAFSTATVVAHRYRSHRWVPYAAYGAAGLVAFSRVSVSAHFASDAFAGAALGYAISRFAVLRY
ncbi:MAG: phosphatase PAP2 family protein [Acidobacteriaceae bacterium]|nr:phosphatase PAP2 family protein [Acidobacteriaceae bacterium]